MKLFYSKILLFGEYGIIKNSKGLAIPYNFYKGTLKTLAEVEAECEPNGQKREDARKSNEALKAFASHLETLTNEANPIVVFHRGMGLVVAVLWWLLSTANTLSTLLVLLMTLLAKNSSN